MTAADSSGIGTASRLTANFQAGERGVAFQRTRYGTCTLRPKTIPCKAKRVSKTRAMTRPHISSQRLSLSARVDSLPISRLVSVELRALNMARAPSGPKPLSAKQSASAKHAQLHAHIYHRSDFHCSKGRLTVKIQLDECGVTFQRTRYGTCTLRSNFVACQHVCHTQQGTNTVACSTTRHDTRQNRN
jgi:hypothetical protein